MCLCWKWVFGFFIFLRCVLVIIEESLYKVIRCDVFFYVRVFFNSVWLWVVVWWFLGVYGCVFLILVLSDFL